MRVYKAGDWDRGYFAQRCDAPLKFTTVMTHGSASFIFPPCCTGESIDKFGRLFKEWQKHAFESVKRP